MTARKRPGTDERSQLRIPGPTPVPPRVMRAAGLPMVNHRGAGFKELHQQVTAGLQQVFGTAGEVLLLTGSGTAAMEAAVVNTVSPGERALVLVGGKFGERWEEICRAFGIETRILAYDWHTGADPVAVKEALQADPDIAAVFATHNESSTGVLNDIAAISAAREGHQALLVVDTVSGLGGAPLPVDEWRVDVAVTGSQKCLMLPPGLAFVAVAESAQDRIAQVTTPRYYLDLRTYRASAAAGESPFTPNVSLVFALAEALDMLEEEGLQASFGRHALMRDMTRAGVKAMGLQPFVADRWASPTVTAVTGPADLDVEVFRKRLQTAYGVELAGGQGEMKGQIFRIGHMGHAGPLDILTILAATEMALQEAGHPLTLGAGVAAAQEVWSQWG